jgi:hypothetical protein
MGIEAFLLGVSSGPTCLATCAPVLVPCLMGGIGGNSLGSDVAAVIRFLSGRLCGYLVFAVVAWSLGLALASLGPYQEPIVGVCYLALAVFLLTFAFSAGKSGCARTPVRSVLHSVRSPALLPFAAGLASGLNFCPPFLLATLSGSQAGSLPGSLAFFAAFFLGTSIFFIPFPLVGLLRRYPAVPIVGKMAAGVVGTYYGYLGLTMAIGGIGAS